MPKLRHSWSDSQLRDNSLTKIPGGTSLDCHGFVNTKSQGMLNRAVGALRWVGCKVRLTCVGAQHAASHLGKAEASKLLFVVVLTGRGDLRKHIHTGPVRIVPRVLLLPLLPPNIAIRRRLRLRLRRRLSLRLRVSPFDRVRFCRRILRLL